MVLEPILAVLTLVAIILLPSAHGVLAEESIGLQPVLVRQIDANDGACAIGSRSLDPKTSALQTEKSIDAWSSVQSADRMLPTDWTEKGKENHEWKSNRASGPCTCTSDDLAALDEEIEAFRQAWQEVTLTRISEVGQYSRARKAYESATDQLLAKALRLRCSEAFRRLWVLLPEPGEFVAQPRIAEYLVNRFSEAVERDGFALYGHILAPPRGEERDRIGLFMRLDADRWVLREIERSEATEILVLPNERSRQIDETIVSVRSSPIPHRLDQLVLYPSAYTLEQALDLYDSSFLPHSAQGRLITLIGAIGKVGGREATAQQLRAVSLLGEVARSGLDPEASAVDRHATELASAAVTSLGNMGGPAAARELAHVLSASSREGEAIPLEPDRVEAVATLATAAGLLAGDLRESLQVFRAGRDPVCQYEETEYGPALSPECESAEATALTDLIAFLARVVPNEEFSLDIRTAACSGLGLSLEPSAQNRAFGLGVKAVREGEDRLAGTCLIHTPSRLKDPQREWLVAFARGRRDVDAEQEVDPVPEWLRDLSLIELQEAGLWLESELVFDLLLGEKEGELLKTVAAVIEDVDPREAKERIADCLQDETSKITRRRCVLAAGLINRVEDGDYGFTEQILAPQLRAHAEESAREEEFSGEPAAEHERFLEEACAAASALAVRGGNEAEELLEDHALRCFEVAMALGGNPRGGLIEMLATGWSSRDLAEERLGEGASGLHDEQEPSAKPSEDGDLSRLPFEAEPVAPGLAAARTAVAMGDLESFLGMTERLAEGGREQLELLEEVARGDEDLFAGAALGALLGEDRARWAPLAAELYASAEAGYRVLLAGKFLEDGSPEDNARRLLGCVDDPFLGERCALGFALLAGSWPGNERVMQELEARAPSSPGACRALAELAVRARKNPLDVASACPEAGRELLEASDAQMRWAIHLRALISVLREEGVSGESRLFLEAEAEQLEEFLELLDSMATTSS